MRLQRRGLPKPGDLLWRRADPYRPHLTAGPFTLIKRTTKFYAGMGKYHTRTFWILRIELVPQLGSKYRNSKVMLFGCTLSAGKELAQASFARYYAGQKVAGFKKRKTYTAP